MTAPVDSAKNSVSAQRSESPSTPQQTSVADKSYTDQVCWVEVKQYQYQPDHQVELLHLQAEADALLLQLQAIRQRQSASTPISR